MARPAGEFTRVQHLHRQWQITIPAAFARAVSLTKHQRCRWSIDQQNRLVIEPLPFAEVPSGN